MPKFKFEKEKFIRLMKSKGVSAALTALHEETNQWENETFEGSLGYQPELWEQLNQVREFSRELWEIALQTPDETASN
jgi:hypothetical protein